VWKTCWLPSLKFKYLLKSFFKFHCFLIPRPFHVLHCWNSLLESVCFPPTSLWFANTLIWIVSTCRASRSSLWWDRPSTQFTNANVRHLTALGRHFTAALDPAIEDAAVVGLPHEDDGERLLAFVVLS
jgi:hypothetical protein